MKIPKYIVSIGVPTGLVAGLMISLSASTDLGTAHQGTPLNRVETSVPPGVPPAEARPIHPGAEAEARHHRELAQARQREEGVLYGARDVRPAEPAELDEFQQIEGQRVENSRGDHLGDVEDLAIDLDLGRVEFVVVSTDSDELRAVPPRALQRNAEDDALVLDVTERRWRQAPTIKRDEIAMLGEDRRSREIYRYYEQDFRARAFGAPRGRPDVERPETEMRQPPDRGAPEAGPLPGEPHSEPRAEIQDRRHVEWAERAQERQRREFGARNRQAQVSDDPATLNNPRLHYSVRGSPRGPDARVQQEIHEEPQTGELAAAEDDDAQVYGQRRDRREETTWRERRDHPERQAHRTKGELKQASELMGQEIHAEGESLGEVSDILVDLNQGRVHYVILEDSQGGERNRYAIPMQELEIERDVRLSVNTTRDQLRQAPAFEQEAAAREQRIFRYEGLDQREFAAPLDRDIEVREEQPLPEGRDVERELEEDLRSEEEAREFGAPPDRDSEAEEPRMEEDRDWRLEEDEEALDEEEKETEFGAPPAHREDAETRAGARPRDRQNQADADDLDARE